MSRPLLFGLFVCLMHSTMVPLAGQSGAKNGEWSTYGADLGSTRYSPLDQINRTNFSNLEVAWRFKTDNLGPRPEFNLESTPLMVKGVLYAAAGTRRSVVAVDAGSGELLWKFSYNEGKRAEAAPRQLSGRGLAYWTDGRSERIIYVTPGYQMIALDAKIGRPVPGFGKDGMVDLKLDDDQKMDLITGEIGLHAAPVVAGNTIIVGAAHLPGSVPKSRRNEKGYVRAFDARTGKRLWIFHTIPLADEYGNETWENNSWTYTGNTGVWGQISVDEELGLVYLPVEMPTGDYYGGHRPGNNLFGSSIVALDLKTGQRKWHYQFIHHDIWDWDTPCAPILVDVTVDGRPIKAVAQPTKQGFIYVFDRATGRPIWPIEERAVPKGDVPGEWYSATQPFPTKPPAFERQGVSIDDLIDFTPELRAEAVKLASLYKLGPIFTPPVASKWEGPRAMLMLPSTTGGANWQGGSYDPDTGIMYIFSNTGITDIGLVNNPQLSDMNFIRGTAPNPNAPPPSSTAGGGGGEGGGPALNIQGLPLVKPPYGRITAIDLNKGEMVWQIAHGETPDNIRNHPALKGLKIPRTGRQGRIGTLVTKTLLIAGEGGFFTTPSGQRGAMLRAYDKANGQEVGSVYMPAPQTGSPMTYMLNGKQHIIVSIGGGGYSSEFIAFRLPN
ncbi:MAG: quinoprotein glucose dehydrogenase [Acidobacteria bacterium 13_1_40CM_56_16]|nr:MAG: quinoprotein glucose dehydrogenase [Acidobacteria bacterium 13_1_40CM_56_16]